MSTGSILNISSYKFVALSDTQALRDALYQAALERELKGTVLIAEEGINLFLAGSAEGVRGWVDQLRADPRFADLAPKESWSEAVPFKKLLVKVKPEIIRMNMPAIRPDQLPRAPALPAATLARWLAQGHDDEGRPVVTLDTRNAFEVDYGTFDGAIDWRINKFTEFPAALAAHREELMGKTVVSFCTGGIRCEKAAIVLQQQGLDGPVYQLEGGILKYFEETGGPHYHGSCFVFDQREALDAGLAPSTDFVRPASEAHRG
ncbi:sulfurtransferase [Paucibacter sp. APW11]|uniref:Sulfurtransferase n=1 Tax=Roseateles aquae TaxID=3077235 RepID=A0ABU3P695_9BURK|nr:sulfurtransferase [Paucibacter sp. APW11]MDT8998088.1 sulfurtransferase [Paucibacter sp. APW11]